MINKIQKVQMVIIFGWSKQTVIEAKKYIILDDTQSHFVISIYILNEQILFHNHIF